MALTNEQLRAFIPRTSFLVDKSYLPTVGEDETEVTTSYGIPNTNAFVNSGGGGYYPGSPKELVGNYQSIVDARQGRLNNPPSTFLGFNTMRDQELTGADLGEYIGSNTAVPRELTAMGKVQDFFTPQSAQSILEDGYEEPRFQPGIIGTIMSKIDNYRNLPKVDQAFIAQNMGYTGPTVFGENTTGLSKDPFGLNIRSAFGNYAERVGVESEKLGDLLSGKQAEKYGKGTSGISFNAGTGMFEAIDDTDQAAINAALKATQMNKMNIAKYNFYTNKNLEYADLVNKNAELQGIADTKIAQDFAAKNPNYGDAEKNINPGSGGGHGYDPQHDYSGTSTKDKHDRASDLGFSDIRLKENVELIGKSPSNINIYKFNYKDSPTTYQGAMAHEVPWASIKHSNGYMMVDYNKIDVNFKKI